MSRRSPIHEQHVALGAKLTDFGGWEMPLSYPTGTLEEVRACRTGAAVFDVSHLGTVRVEGPGALDRLQVALTNDLGKIAPGRAQYTHLLDESGGVLDDIIVWWLADEVFDVMPNASNTERVRAAIGGVDTTASRCILALQGPQARLIAAKLSADFAAVERFHVRTVNWHGVGIVVAGTGYTGEDGIELAVPATAAADLLAALVVQGAVPAGLGARDVLRLEAGLPLHGHELSPDITPLEARLNWVLAWDKPNFVGKHALETQRAAGIPRQLLGLRSNDRQPLREHADVYVGDEMVGQTSSGGYSPTLDSGIALAFLSPGLSPGAAVSIDLRGRRKDATVVKPPFIHR